MSSINVKLYKNFIKDLSGRDFYTNERIHSIVGFYAFAIDNSNTVDDECGIFFRKRVDFINVDGKYNKLATNLYTDNSESITMGSNFKKLSYAYEVLHEGQQPKIVGNEILFSKESILSDEKLGKMSLLKEQLGTDFRIAFDIYSSSKDGKLDNGSFLSSVIAYEGFRPVIDIHNLKILTNLISVTVNRNQYIHAHDLNEVTKTVSLNTINSVDYKDLSVNSLTEFINPNDTDSFQKAPVCFEDWNLMNLTAE